MSNDKVNVKKLVISELNKSFEANNLFIFFKQDFKAKTHLNTRVLKLFSKYAFEKSNIKKNIIKTGVKFPLKFLHTNSIKENISFLFSINNFIFVQFNYLLFIINTKFILSFFQIMKCFTYLFFLLSTYEKFLCLLFT